MKNILERLRAGERLVCDGAMGTFLQKEGLVPGSCPELWCVEKPEIVKGIHQQYADAGADILETNSFGGTHYKLKHYGLESRVEELNCAAASLAREVAGDSRYVLGSMGSTGEFIEPLGTATEDDMVAAYREQALALEKGGADGVIVETMTALEEACAAIKAVKANTSLFVVVSFTFDPQAHGGYATMMGVTPSSFAENALKAGADIIGSNCGTGPDDMIRIAAELRAAAPDALISVMPNAGAPVIENGETVFKETPEQMADKVSKLVEAGANIVGGCCGTTPAHIRAVKSALVG